MNLTPSKIGLALGSGSARGWAHIGVIRELVEMGVPIHGVAGCSIGALVGGIYALGKLDKLEEWARSLTFRHIAKLLMDPDWGSGGLLRGERVFKALRELGFDTEIEKLPIPFAAVSTDMRSGHEVWMRRGSLLDAVRSSCSLPGLVKPHYHESRWMLDGGIVNPIPVSLSRALGCNIIIAVNLNSNLLTPPKVAPKPSSFHQLIETTKQWLPHQVKEWSHWIASWADIWHRHPITTHEDLIAHNHPTHNKQLLDELHLPPSYRQVVWSMMTIMQDRITRYRMMLDEPDIEITPDLSHLSIIEFHAAQQAIEEGRQAVRRQADGIRALLDPSYNFSTQKNTPPSHDQLSIIHTSTSPYRLDGDV